MIRVRFLALAAGVLGSASVVAQTPALSIELANKSPGEQRAKEQLERFFKEHDLSPWLFTKKIRIDQKERPHSHPVLTLNTRHVEHDGRALAGFVHEEIHWFLVAKPRDEVEAIGEAMRLYPGAPESLADGGSGTRLSTLRHLIVCRLELESMRALLGAEQGTAVIRDVMADAQSAGLGYHWIYQKVLEDEDQLSALVRRHKLALPGVP